MRINTILLVLGGLAVGFAIGFLTASSINRSELNRLRAEAENSKTAAGSPTSSANAESLSDDEIRDKIAEADSDPANVAFQKNLGLALYRYGALKGDSDLISESVRLLERAAKLSPNDDDTTVGLGNAWFDIGYSKKDNAALAKARTYYEVLLAKKPQDSGVRTDLGMTYFLQQPPDDQRATAEFKKVLSSDPKNEKALQFIIQSLARQGDRSTATAYLEDLRRAYPQNVSIDELSAEIQRSSGPSR